MSEEQWWIVLWRAIDANIPVDFYWASSGQRAVAICRERTEYGALTCVSDLLYAVPAGTDRETALNRYLELVNKADQDQQVAPVAVLAT
ncbi:MAG: hypothetical protein A2912_04930 [Candidatus Buchananbacteria bacterium RIFCSPLOWO2_01_FULL_40_23b]|uniref:Uncharacterized protein n=1 Tax=Candidatus Buchananbacteria bacterium RIFCSPLOWO2_01_FULL_40_23b TaxID=1797544 RepID=A0A1G1YNM9_9BACT|nr:MAG: hypothetical protein A2912_04930 [Candidatus Buchananbacteria bacterium RIFCSPLOWO2_01_FULL_40_23b]